MKYHAQSRMEPASIMPISVVGEKLIVSREDNKRTISSNKARGLQTKFSGGTVGPFNAGESQS